jgi:hypothetical protein
MIYPLAEDVLRTIETTFETVIVPSLTGTTEQSAAATIGHLLRHVRLRIAREGQVLFDDIAAARALLGDVRDYLAGIGESVAALDAVLTRRALAPGIYPSLALVADEAGGLRRALTAALERLQALRAAHGETPAYQALRAAIRSYLGTQLIRENELIEPAFAGLGPRR